MKRIASVISGALFAFIAVSAAHASGDEGYEHHEGYEYGRRYSNPSGYTNYGYNNTYRDHDRYEYRNRNTNSVPRYNNYNSGNNRYNNNGYRYNNSGNSSYRNHELREYRR